MPVPRDFDRMPQKRPHVVLIMADHLRRDCLSCYGDLGVRTPHLDALSEESVIFDRAYCSSPLCVPTRVSMYTGKWPHVTGAMVNGHQLEKEQPYSTLPPQHRTLYEQLDTANYGITHIGVQHCRAQPTVPERVPRAHIDTGYPAVEALLKQHGFDPKELGIADARRPCPDFHDGKPIVKHFLTPRAIKRYPYPAEFFPDVVWAGLAEQAIEKLDPTRPQYIETLFWAPHPPLVVPEPYFSMYPPGQIRLAETVAKWCEGQPATLLHQFCGYMGAGLTREDWRPAWSAYFGLVTMVDECIGRVVCALKRKGIWDDALVVFVQDHGEMLGCHSLWEKNCCYEEAAHIPLLIKPPGGGTGRRRQLVGHVDYSATVCDYAGTEPLPGQVGQSLRPVIEKASAAWRDHTFIEYNGNHGRGTPIRAIVADVAGGSFKYIHNPGDIDELYDLAADPMEMRSLVNSAGHQAARTELRSRLGRWMRETNDPVSTPE